MPTEAEILQVASRETSLASAAEFEPIARGPLYAVLALIPLGAMAVAGLLWGKVSGKRLW